MKINKKYEPLLFSVFMALGMSFFMSFFMLLIKMGIKPSFFKALISEWALGFAISLIPSFILPPLISKILKNFINGN